MQQRHKRLKELLNMGQEFTIQEIRDELDLKSEEHARRIIKKLEKAGVPIETEFRQRRKYFFIRESLRTTSMALHTLRFNEEELLALSIAAQATQAIFAPTPLHAPLLSAFRTLLAGLSSQAITFDLTEQANRWHFGAAPSVPISHTIFNLLRQARADGQSVLVDYFTASSGEQHYNRKIDPYCIALRGGTWMLVAYCHKKKRVLDFNIAGISKAKLCDPLKDATAQFIIQENFDIDLHFRDRFNSLTSGEFYVVRLLVEPKQARYFSLKEYHPTQQIEEVRKDGRTIVSFEVPGLDDIRSFVQSYGTGVTVLEPPELVDIMKQETAILSERYG